MKEKHKFYFIIDKHNNVVSVEDVNLWGEWMASKDNKIIGNERLEDRRISTVFLGIDHGFWNGKSLFFETMIFFDDERDELCYRYETYYEAIRGHYIAVRAHEKAIEREKTKILEE